MQVVFRTVGEEMVIWEMGVVRRDRHHKALSFRTGFWRSLKSGVRNLRSGGVFSYEFRVLSSEYSNDGERKFLILNLSRKKLYNFG